MKQGLGILVHGENHWVVCGPLPNRETALALVRYWSLIQIGGAMPPNLQAWTIRTREFREDWEWAVMVPGDDQISPAVALLLEELSARGMVMHDSQSAFW